MGVARLSLGGWRLGIDSGGSAKLLAGIAGAALLLTGRWLGEAGIDRPSLGTLLFGGLNSGAGEAISVRSGGGSPRPPVLVGFGAATMDECV